MVNPKTRVVHSEANQVYRVQMLKETGGWFKVQFEWVTFETFRYSEEPDSYPKLTKARAEELAIKRAKAYTTDEVIYES